MLNKLLSKVVTIFRKRIYCGFIETSDLSDNASARSVNREACRLLLLQSCANQKYCSEYE